MLLCVCKVVRVRQLQSALREGRISSVEEAQEQTGAGTGCGACLGALREMVDGERARCASSPRCPVDSK
jgi:assimilatory nitrate reductase catalytic subunit